MVVSGDSFYSLEEFYQQPSLYHTLVSNCFFYGYEIFQLGNFKTYPWGAKIGVLVFWDWEAFMKQWDALDV